MKTNIFGSILAALALMAVATACTIDASDDTDTVPPAVDDTNVDDDTGDDMTPPPDDGTPADDTNVDDGNLADVYTLSYAAPSGATEVVLEGNLRGDWNDELARHYDRTVTWTGRLNYDQLDRPACTATARGSSCGYVVSLWFDTAPYFGCVLDPAGLPRTVGEFHVSGPLPIEFVAVENGIGGCNYHLRLKRAEPR